MDGGEDSQQQQQGNHTTVPVLGNQGESGEQEKYVICILEQPNHTVCKFWGFKANESELNNFITTCKTLKQYGATKLNIYECITPQVGMLPSSHEKLLGVGADDINTVLSNLSQVSGGRIYGTNLKLINQIQL
jgi:hypothetical protein